MDKKYSKYQQNIIKNYYENRDAISLQRLSELVTELYLAEGKKKQQLWETAAEILLKLGLPKARVDHVLAKKDVQILAGVVKELEA